MMTFDQFKARADQIPYQYLHPFFLYALVKWFKPTTVVEVGSHIGMSAVWMARGLQENAAGRLYCIDSFCWIRETQEDQWNRNVDESGVRDYIQLVKGRSTEVTWPPAVDMVFIDANHTYPAVKTDYQLALASGATCIVFHDSATYEGVHKLTGEIRAGLNHTVWEILETTADQGLFVLHKIPSSVPLINFDRDEQWDKPIQ